VSVIDAGISTSTSVSISKSVEQFAPQGEEKVMSTDPSWFPESGRARGMDRVSGWLYGRSRSQSPEMAGTLARQGKTDLEKSSSAVTIPIK
jgi:hypothetical protein